MKQFKLAHKITAISLALLFLSVSLSSINDHTYTVGLNNFHKDYLPYSCWGGYT